MLGLGMRAGALAVGTGGIRAALRRDELALVIVASDRSKRTDQRVVRLAHARGTPLVFGPVAAELGHAVGRSALQAVGVRDAQLAAGIKARSAKDGL